MLILFLIYISLYYFAFIYNFDFIYVYTFMICSSIEIVVPIMMMMILVVHVVEEHSMMLGKELINIFDPELIVVFDVGAGELIKAALAQRILSIATVPNRAHKDFVMEILRKFVASVNLVNLAIDLPTKTPAMIKFENQNPENDHVKRVKVLKATTPVAMQADCC